MGLLDSLKSLITPGEKKPEAFPSTAYEGFTITPTPMPEGNQFRVCGTISKGEQEHQFIRADLMGSAEQCAKETLRKAQMTIDQLGDGVFK